MPSISMLPSYFMAFFIFVIWSCCVDICLCALSSSSFNSATVYSLLILGRFLMAFALTPNLSVLIDSDSLKIEGEQVMISVVLELPPNESYKILVSLESLYGTCVLFPSVSELMTFPSTESDVLIFFASFKRWPYAWVFDTFSEPARSTK